MAQRITPEEEKILERMHNIDRELRVINDEKFLLNREACNISDTRTWDKTAPFFWGILTIITLAFLIGDLAVGFSQIGMAIAIAIASALPAAVIVLFVLFVGSLVKYNLANSANPATMAKAAKRGIKNRVALKLAITDQIRDLELREIDLKNEKESIKDEYDRISQIEWY